MSRLTLRTINAEIARRGGKETLVRGEGYFYFVNVGWRQEPSSGVYVYRLNELTLDQWLGELGDKRIEAEK
jgi:hypothetical protein